MAGTGTRAIVAALGPEDICGDMAFLEHGKTTAAVVAKEEEVEVEEIKAHEFRDLEAFPRLASRFYRSLALRWSKIEGDLRELPAKWCSATADSAQSSRPTGALKLPVDEAIPRCSIIGTSLPFGADLNFMQSG